MRGCWLVFLSLSPMLLSPACGDTPEGEPALTRLHAEGTELRDARGRLVRLKGVNLGAWMFHETWISNVGYTTHGLVHTLGWEQGIGEEVDAALQVVGPSGDASWLEALEAELLGSLDATVVADLLQAASLFPSVRDDSDLPLRHVLADRFGLQGRDRLLDTFQGAWMQEQDIAFLASQGFNLVRVPMGYRGLTTGPDETAPASLSWNEAALARLDALLDWCAAHRVYAVVDLQESPGGHNDYSGPALLYADEHQQALTVELWEMLSDRLRARDEVAAYSLLAEPMSAPDAQARDDLYDRLIQAIRARGDDHLLVLHDGFRGPWTFPDPAERGWENVIYSTHLFEWSADSLEDYESYFELWRLAFGSAQASQGVPYFIGSFSTMHDADWAYDATRGMVALFAEQGWSWSLWTYKAIDDPIDQALYGTQTAWGLLGRLHGVFDRPDPWRDDEATLEAKLAAYATLDLRPNALLLEALSEDLSP